MTDQRPAKRPRLDMTAFKPDGFAPSKPIGPRRVLRVPVFESGFDAPGPSELRRRRAQQQQAGNDSTPESASSASAQQSTSKETLDTIKSQTSNATVRKPIEFPRPDFGRPVTPVKEKTKRKTWRVLKPPVFDLSSLPKSSSSSSSRRCVPLTSLRPVLPAPPKDGKKASGLRPLPVFEIPSTGSSKPKKPLRPMLPPPRPVLPVKASLQGKKLVPITKTRIAIATDPHTESGAQELLAIVLQQHGSGYVSPFDREMMRGLEQSPEKRAKYRPKPGIPTALGGGLGQQKFPRGGLAETASRRFSAMQSSQSLWEIEMARLAGRRRIGDGERDSTFVPRSDVRIRIETVFCTTPVNQSGSRSSRAPPVVLARCTVLRSDLPPPSYSPFSTRHRPTLHAQMVTTVDAERAFQPHASILLLFRVSVNAHAAALLHAQDSRERTLDEGTEVCVWRPWYSLPLSASALGLEVPTPPPASLPAPSLNYFTNSRAGQEDRVWMVSRYYVLPPAPSPEE